MPARTEESVGQRLATVPLFASLSKRQLEVVARAGALRSYGADERIVGKGEKSVGFYLVLDGRVEVRADGKTVAVLGPGNFFGEMALFEEQPRTADVVAVAATRCLVLSRWEFWNDLSQEPDVIRALMTVLVHRLRATPEALSE